MKIFYLDFQKKTAHIMSVFDLLSVTNQVNIPRYTLCVVGQAVCIGEF